MPRRKQRREGLRLLFAVSVLAFVISLFDFFWTGNGIHGSLGALLVIASTLLMAVASGAIAVRAATRSLWSVLAPLILLDILGTGFAAYMLEAWILFALMILALIIWLFDSLATGRRSARPAPEAAAI